MLLALLTDYDMLILGTKEFGTAPCRKWPSKPATEAFRNCVLVAWGKETQRRPKAFALSKALRTRLMWIKVHFVAVVYVCSFLGAMAFGVLQLRFYQHLDERNDAGHCWAFVCKPGAP